MAQINERPILSICIPIYNRLEYLERQLTRFLRDKELFEKQIQLIISDNCSQDDLKACCEKYKKNGLCLIYHHNDINLGADRNFDWCFHHANGQYIWLLGSDDVLVEGFLRKILLQLKEGAFGLIHLSMRPREGELIVYHDHGKMLIEVSYWITFMSSNIIRTDSLSTVDLSNYLKSFMIQVPAYLNACLTTDKNAISYLGHPFEIDTDASNNGGYNLFQVFVENLFRIYQSFIEKGMLPQCSFEEIKKVEYKEFLVGFIIDLLIVKTSKRNNFDLTNAWSILFRHYGRYPYAYLFIAKRLFKSFLNLFLQRIVTLVRGK